MILWNLVLTLIFVPFVLVAVGLVWLMLGWKFVAWLLGGRS